MLSKKRLISYLQGHHTSRVVYGYARQIELYIDAMPNAKNATIKDIIIYVEQLRKRYKKASTIRSMVNGVKKYYEFLIAIGVRKEHPCKYLQLKDREPATIIVENLFSDTMLASFLTYRRKRLPHLLWIRDKALLSILIYQGVERGEIGNIRLQDIDLEKASIYIQASHTLNSRTLPLKSTQIVLLQEYITKIRPLLLDRSYLYKKKRSSTESLFISIRANVICGSAIKDILLQLSKEKGVRITIQKIRQSVIANLLKQHNDVRMVQVFAGHKNINTTEGYKLSDREALMQGIEQYHPLK